MSVNVAAMLELSVGISQWIRFHEWLRRVMFEKEKIQQVIVHKSEVGLGYFK